jgi:hypothetical protein
MNIKFPFFSCEPRSDHTSQTHDKKHEISEICHLTRNSNPSISNSETLSTSIQERILWQ